jgi:SOS-response transcriptional repressor LexA
MKDNKIIERLRISMKDAGINQAKLAKHVGITPQAVGRWFKNGVIGKDSLISAAKITNVSVGWLLTGEGESIKRPSDFNGDNFVQAPNIKGHYPLISWVQAGAWCEINEMNIADAERFPCPVKCSNHTFVLTVQGISMQPTFNEGDLIFVDPDADIIHGKYIVARLDDENEATFKQLIIEGGKKFLKPVNPNWPEQIIPINGNCTIVGVVVFAGKVF